MLAKSLKTRRLATAGPVLAVKQATQIIPAVDMKRIAVAGCFAAVLFALASPAQAMYTAWPFNGRVINQSTASIAAWDGEHDFYAIAGGVTSSNLYDVDHIRAAANSNWCKIGANTVTVSPLGHISGCECWVANAADECAPGQQRSVVAQVASLVFGRERTQLMVAYLERAQALMTG